MRILHIIRNKDDCLALSMAKEHAQKNAVSILLLHDAVLIDSDRVNGLKVFACKDDVLARGTESQFQMVDYPDIVNLVFDKGKVITW